MAHYKDSEYNDIMLWYCMKEDFVGWIKETWAPAKKDIVWDFRNFLREYRVFVPKDGGIIGDNIQERVIDAKEKLLMTTSTFYPCFLITTPFGIVGMQTNETIILGDDQFSALEEDELVKANLMGKPKEKLNLTTPLLFNGCILSLNEDSITLRQKG
jgi:hypothetical protein